MRKAKLRLNAAGRRLAEKLLDRAGYAMTRNFHQRDIVSDSTFQSLYEECRPYTLTSMERMYALYQAVEYIVRHGVPGEIAECGVWRGGSIMLAALALLEFGEPTRHLYLYDTYCGMSQPTDRDVDCGGLTAREWMNQAGPRPHGYASLQEVRANLFSTSYPPENICFVQGPVEQTIPGKAPDHIALLRLDTDFYESTLHELVHLFPRVSAGGVLIIDDYGHWRGAQEATDQYFAQNRTPILLNRIDYTGRIGIKINGA